MKRPAIYPNWLQVTILVLGEVSAALGLVVLVGSYTRNVTILKPLSAFVPTEYNAALGFILCGTGLLSIGLGRRHLAIASAMAAVVGLLVIYFGIEQVPIVPVVEAPASLSEATFVVGIVMALLLALAVHFGQTAWLHAKEGRLANEKLEKEILERKAAEEALAEKAAELERSNAELEQFAYVTSHDLQEPLRMVASFTQLLAKRYKGKLDSDADEFIGYTLDGVTRMHQLIKDLLVYSRVRTRGKEFEATDSSAVLVQVLADLKVAIEEAGATVTSTPLPLVMADSTQLGQLFQNLIGNALKFRSAELPRIHLSANCNGKEWIFSVSDNGMGIEPQYAERIFVIFQRLHGKDEYPGTGIGLAICKKIVERHGGRIWVESQPGRGSAFYFALPA